jgi:hypothetical protein
VHKEKKSSSPKLFLLFCTNNHPPKAEKVLEIFWTGDGGWFFSILGHNDVEK